jgi:uncharacterized protein YejL (UPF0352 family)
MKVTKTQLKKIIKEELARMEGHESSTDLETMVHDLGTPDLILQVLQAVSQEVPGFVAAFKQHYDYFMSE